MRMSSTASAAVRLSAHCENLGGGNSRNPTGNVVEKPMSPDPRPLVWM